MCKEALDRRDAVGACTSLAREAVPRRNLDAAAVLTRRSGAWRRPIPRMFNYAAISRAFGTPKPTLANSYQPELLNLRTFPTLMGYSSRIMAESWESNTAVLRGTGRRTAPAALAAERADSGVDAEDGGAAFSPRTWRIGRRCCARCASSATMCAPRRRLAAADEQKAALNRYLRRTIRMKVPYRRRSVSPR